MKVGVLGTLDVLEGDRHLLISSARQRSLIVMLALEAGRVVSADRLIDGMWGDDAPGDALNALRHHVSRLRKLVGRSLVTKGCGYLLAVDPEEVDALHFARLAGESRTALRHGDAARAGTTLRSALALWRGDPLVEFLERDWARQEASRLEELHLAALEDRFDADLALGLHAEVAEEVRRVVGAHPFRERLWAQLMLALYRCGRQTDALAAYGEARAILVEEHGLSPGPELAALERAILAQDADLVAPAPPSRVALEPEAVRPPALPSPPAVPAFLTSFIGRHEPVAIIGGLLREGRLITLTGPPGVGKTRLALEVGRVVQRNFPDGVWPAELAPLTDARAVSDVLLALFGVPQGGRVVEPTGEDDRRPSPVARLTEQLGNRRALLILDNCEHLLGGVAALIEPLLAGCPDLHVLATSREVLGVAGEAQWPVPPLSLPTPDVADPRELVSSEAVRLFEDRAIKVRPSFALTAEVAPAVAAICRRVDGLPLAIELAAARVNVLPVTHIAAALDDRFRLLVGGSRNASPRQQTLRAAVDWSYDLLEENERAMFEQLSVFAGGCSLRAAEWIGAQLGVTSFDLLDVLGGLADKSLLTATAGADGQPRYRMLETLRAYGNERLRAGGRSDVAQRRHAKLFATMAEAGEQGLRGAEHFRWRAALGEELDNLRAALQHALADGDADVAVRVAGSLGFYFASNDRHGEGRAWLKAALAVPHDPAPSSARARALSSLGQLTVQLGDVDRGIEDAERGLALAVASGDQWQTALSTAILAFTLDAARCADRVPELLVLARVRYDAIGDSRADWGVAHCELLAAVNAARRGDLDAAERASAELRVRAERLGDAVFRTWSRLLGAWTCERRGNLEAADEDYGEALEVTRPLGKSPFVAFILAIRGRIAMQAGQLDRARTLQLEAVDMVDVAASPWFASFAHHALAVTTQRAGDLDAAAALHRQAVAQSPTSGSGFAQEPQFRVLGGSPAARSLIALAALARAAGDAAEAERLGTLGVERAVAESDPEAIAHGLEELAAGALAGGAPERAAMLLGASESAPRGARAARDRLETDDAERTRALAGSALGSGDFERLMAVGRVLPPDEALARARRA